MKKFLVVLMIGMIFLVGTTTSAEDGKFVCDDPLLMEQIFVDFVKANDWNALQQLEQTGFKFKNPQEVVPLAIQFGNSDSFVKKLFEKNLGSTNYGQQANLNDCLLLAISQDRVELIQFLKSRGANLRETSTAGLIKIGNSSAGQALTHFLQNNELRQCDLEKIFFYAAAQGNIEMMALLKELGVNNFEPVLKKFEEYGNSVDFLYLEDYPVEPLSIISSPWTGKNLRLIMARNLLKKWIAEAITK